MWKAYALVRQLDAAAEMHVVLRNWIVGQSYLGAVAICDNEKPSSVCQESTSGLDLLVIFDAALECCLRQCATSLAVSDLARKTTAIFLWQHVYR